MKFDADLDVSSSSTQAFRIESSGAIWTANLVDIEEVGSGPRRFLADDPNEVAGGDGNVKILNPGERKTETVHMYHLHLTIIILTMACMLVAFYSLIQRLLVVALMFSGKTSSTHKSVSYIFS